MDSRVSTQRPWRREDRLATQRTQYAVLIICPFCVILIYDLSRAPPEGCYRDYFYVRAGMITSTPAGRAVTRYRIHWHVLLTHFPISFFAVAFGFQILHLFISPACFELATNVALIAGAVVMVRPNLG